MSTFKAFRRNPKDPRAFEEWYREVYPGLFVSAFRMTHGDRPLAEDLCHDAILAFITRGGLQKVHTAEQSLAYLRTSVAHGHVDALRKARRESAMHPLPEGAQESSTPDGGEAYADLLGRLDADDQELLGLLLSGEPLSGIARSLGITYTNAGVRVHRIRKKINELT